MTETSANEPSPWRSLWNLPDDVAYLNHGSFGPSPIVVQKSYEYWTRQLEQQPMNFFLREMEPALEKSLAVLANFVGTSRGNLVFVDNATFGMNIVAASTRLETDDEVLVNDHEYGAVTRLWRRTCQKAGASLVTCELPAAELHTESVFESIFTRVTSHTKLIVVSHVTSPTAMVMPVEKICRRAKELGIPVCIDGPHAVAMLPLNLRELDCDFYTASCHKWLSAPFGSGFLYVAPRQQKRIQPAVISWGGSISGRQPGWKDEFNWLGTRNPAAFLATADAIRFLLSTASPENCTQLENTQSTKPHTMLDELQQRSRQLTQLATNELRHTIEAKPIIHDRSLRNDSMVSFVLPVELFPTQSFNGKAGQRHPLQDWLWQHHRIEIPLVAWGSQLLIRASAHLYNSPEEYSRLAAAVRDFTHEV